MKKSAFTLAEVLTTLAIIGVVAAITIPVISNKSATETYRVSANKALVTITEAMSMREAMDDTSFADFTVNGWQGSLGGYLFNPPQDEQRVAMPAQSVNKHWYVLKNGMLFQAARNVSLKNGNSSINGSTCLAFEDDTCLVYVDTNGDNGPTRRNGESSNSSYYAYCGQNTTYKPDGVVEFPRASDDASKTPTTNSCPDVVGFLIDVSTGAVTPANQRTRNILATGNAKYEK